MVDKKGFLTSRHQDMCRVVTDKGHKQKNKKHPFFL